MTGSAGQRACSTILGSLASSPRSAILISVFGFCSATTTKYSIDRKLTFLGLTFASTQISLGTLMQFGFSTNLEMIIGQDDLGNGPFYHHDQHHILFMART